MPKCPTCKSESRPRAENAAFPFCSQRCKAIDLGKWFMGEYRVPGRQLAPGEQPLEAAEPDEASGGRGERS
jgi:endogenous inhibitor of DNA gyrase (YacG/DUF329 family)